MMNNFYSANDARLNEATRLISQMNSDELRRLINSDDELTQFVQNLPEVQQMKFMKESLNDTIKQLAARNLGKEPTLNLEKQKLMELHAELARMREQYKSIRGQYDDQSGETNPDVIYTLLQSAATDGERTTEQIAEDFFYGEKSEEEVTEFERRFIDERKRAHELKIKAEKFHELMQMSQATSYLNPHNRTNEYR